MLRIASFAVALVLLTTLSDRAFAAEEKVEKPNVIFIMVDDKHQLFDIKAEKRLTDLVFSSISAKNRIAGNPIKLVTIQAN